MDEAAVLVLQHDVVRLDVGMHDAELLDVVEGQEELLTERLDGHEAETGPRAVLVKRVAEIQRHERKHDAEMAAVNETLVNRNAVFCVLRIVLLDLLQQRQLILRVIRHFLVAAQYLDGDRLVGLRINAAQHRREDTLPVSRTTLYLYAKISPTKDT